MYDLTSFLTTVASSAACIVAILGGFIASKLISIDGERDSVLSRLKQINIELQYHIDERNKIQKENNVSYALDFIQDHVDYLFAQSLLEAVYEREALQVLKQEVMEPFWKTGIRIAKEYIELSCVGETRYNKDNVPVELFLKYQNSYFEYEVCKMVANKTKKALKNTKQNSFPYIQPLQEMLDIPMKTIYPVDETLIAQKNESINLLSVQKKTLEERASELKKPKGMRAGLIIFAMFSVACIILPLVLSPFATNDLLCYNFTKWIVLIVFCLGLGSMFGYLIYLLRWKCK